MRELIQKEQIVTIVPQDFKNSNKGRVLDVDMDGFRMELKYVPEGLMKNHVCDFYSHTFTLNHILKIYKTTLYQSQILLNTDFCKDDNLHVSNIMKIYSYHLKKFLIL